MKKIVIISLVLLLISSCSNQPSDDQTLGSLDVKQDNQESSDVFVKPKTEEEIKKAYYTYIKNAPTTEKSRLSAINRLAELEINRLNNLSKSDTQDNSYDEAADEAIYQSSLQRTRQLLQSSLSEYPDAKGNDKTLYQLARTLDQLGESDQSMVILQQLTENFPESPYYAEAQFRIGEQAFIVGDFITAESAYTEAILTAGNDIFYERSLFKRGWSRYKQSLYMEAAEDYITALKQNKFGDYDSLSASDKDQFDEYFRAIGLAFANLENADALQQYFSVEDDFKYLYKTYTVIADIYIKQARYSDAAETMAQFIQANPQSSKIPLAEIKIIEVWRKGQFNNRVEDSVEKAYSRYNPKSQYWHKPKLSNDNDDQKQMYESLREYILLVASFHQDNYQQHKNKNDFNKANTWYQRYLEHYSAYARQDKVYNLYAELLAAENRQTEALTYFELAAYDSDIILDKEAAYATIVISDQLHQQQPSQPEWINKNIHYALKSAELYPTEKRYQTAILHATEIAFKNKRYDDVITLGNTLPNNLSDETIYKINVIKGLSNQKLERFQDAEIIFADLAKNQRNDLKQKEQQDNLALVIYQQAQQALENNNTNDALQHFARISRLASQSDIAPKALYEAISLAMQNQQWNNAIGYIQQFQKLYPKHALNKDATRQLSSAYLKSDQGAKAAEAFEQISAQENNQDVKMAALWQAAELYESKNNTRAAIRAYQSYADTYTSPYPQYMEAMYKLTQLYQKSGDKANQALWQEKIITKDKQTAKSSKTERTNYIASSTLLTLAQAKQEQFARIQLVEPLANNLRNKKKFMQEAITLYGQASIYSLAVVTTQSTYEIGSIYQAFSNALLKSERPKHLSGDELEQYNILIEDQAFPFEEKAIEFHEINLARIKDGTSNEWISKSFHQLTSLFPVRYNRKGKISIIQDVNR